tara:strand:+ start:1489 stop:1908 length:420 start_codon:yes stop_codon:yes gene_type:complete
MPTWTFGGKLITELSDMPEDIIGFIYKIHNKFTGEFYIGRKSLYSHRKLPPLKGFKRKRKVVKETDWKDYQSSNSEVKKWEHDTISKTILRFCKTKKAMTYYELEEQIKHNALGNTACKNDNILGKFFTKDLEDGKEIL